MMNTVRRPILLPTCVSSPFADYWCQSRRPLSSLVFVMPLLVLYEAGVLILGPAALRSGADVWLRQFLDLMGLTGYFVLPLCTVIMLLAWHHTTHHAWRVSPRVLGGMLAECVALSLALLLLAQLQARLLTAGWLWQLSADTPVAATPPFVSLRQIVAFAGAGIYEEVLFRLLLLPLLWGMLGLVTARPTTRVVVAILLSSLIFSAAHYVGQYGDTWQWFTFLFRFSAGGFFAALFVLRGFGIAAGAHALYDIMAGIV